MKDKNRYWIVIPKSDKREPFIVKVENQAQVWDAIREKVGEVHIEDVICLDEVVDARDLVARIQEFGRSLGFRTV